jgi:hypothetical protein
MMKRISVGIVTLVLAAAGRPLAQSAAGVPSLPARIDAVLARPEFKHAMFGIELTFR